MMVTLATHVLIRPSLMHGTFRNVPSHHLEEKNGLFHVPTRMQSWTFLLLSVKLKILFNVGEMLSVFLIARNSMGSSLLLDFLMEIRRDDSEDAFDIHNTWNIALLLVTVIDFDAGRLAHSCHFAQNHVPNSNGARWQTTRFLTTDALQCLSFVFLSSVEAKCESQSHFLWHTLRHTHKRRMRLRGSSAVTLLRTNNTQRISGCRTGTPEHTSGRNGQEACNKCGSLRWWDLNIFEHDRNVIFGSCLRFFVVRL